jgi:hypothetical protein
VTKNLLGGIATYDDWEMLRNRLAAIPSGLRSLSTRLFPSIDQHYRLFLSLYLPDAESPPIH